MWVEHVARLERIATLRAEAQAAQRVEAMLRDAGLPHRRRRWVRRHRNAQVVRPVSVEVACRRAAGHVVRGAV